MNRTMRDGMYRNTVVFFIAVLLVALTWPMGPAPMSADAAGPRTFPDVPDGHWARGEIVYMAEKGIIAGKPDGRFDPDSPVTRGQLALMLYRMMALPPGQAQFKDVQPGTLLGQAVGAILEKGIAKGYPDGRFRPNEPITRGQMAVMLTRALGLEEMAILNKNVSLPFADRFVESQRGYIYVVSYYNVIRGSERNGKRVFRAGETASRAETAVILFRTWELMKRGNLLVADPAKAKEKGLEISQRVIGRLPRTVFTPYGDPLHNERWIVWMSEKPTLDPGLEKPSGYDDALIRQAVLCWYGIQSQTTHTAALPYVFVYRADKNSASSFEKLPPVFGLDGDDVYIVYPDDPKVLHRFNLKTQIRTETVLPRYVFHEDDAFYPYPAHPLPIQHGVIALMPDVNGDKSKHYYYDLANDTLFQSEGTRYGSWEANSQWIIRYDSGLKELIVFDRKKKTMKRFGGFENVYDDSQLAGDWFIYSSWVDTRHVRAVHLETGEQREIFPNGMIWEVVQTDGTLIFQSLQNTDSLEMYVYDLDDGRLDLLPDFRGLKQVEQLKDMTDDSGRVYVVSLDKDWYGPYVYVMDLSLRQLAGRYNLGDAGSGGYSRYEFVAITRGELVVLWQQQYFQELDKVKVLRIPLAQMMSPS